MMLGPIHERLQCAGYTLASAATRGRRGQVPTRTRLSSWHRVRSCLDASTIAQIFCNPARGRPGGSCPKAAIHGLEISKDYCQPRHSRMMNWASRSPGEGVQQKDVQLLERDPRAPYPLLSSHTHPPTDADSEPFWPCLTTVRRAFLHAATRPRGVQPSLPAHVPDFDQTVCVPGNGARVTDHLPPPRGNAHLLGGGLRWEGRTSCLHRACQGASHSSSSRDGSRRAAQGRAAIPFPREFKTPRGRMASDGVVVVFNARGETSPVKSGSLRHRRVAWR